MSSWCPIPFDLFVTLKLVEVFWVIQGETSWYKQGLLLLTTYMITETLFQRYINMTALLLDLFIILRRL